MRDSTRNSKIEKCIKKTVSFQPWLYDLISNTVNPNKEQRDNWSKSLHFKVRQLQEKSRENKELNDTIAFLKEKLLPEGSEEKVVKKALGLDYPDDCYDMLPIEGKPNLRQCICPRPKRPVPVPLVKGRYIVDNPRICRRCKALGYRKVKQKSERKLSQHNGGKSERRKPTDEFRGQSKVYFDSPYPIWRG